MQTAFLNIAFQLFGGVGDDLGIIKWNKNIPVNVMEFQTFRETIGKFTQ